MKKQNWTWWLVPLILLLLIFIPILILNQEFLRATRQMDHLVDSYEGILKSWTRTRVILESGQNVNVVEKMELLDNIIAVQAWLDSEEIRRMRQFAETSETVDSLKTELSHMNELFQLAPDSIRVEQLKGIDKNFEDIQVVLKIFRTRLDGGFSFLLQAQVLLILLLMVLIVIALEDRTRQRLYLEATRRIQIETARAQEEERNRIALDLHDDIAQELSWMRLKMADGQSLVDQTDVIDSMIKRIRNMSQNLRTPNFQTEFFDDAIRDLIVAAEQHSGLRVQYLPGVTHPDDQSEVYGQLYRIIQECLNNARKHAGDCRVFVEIQEEAEVVYLEYRDDGEGFDIAELADNDRLGLKGIRNRVNIMDGKLEIRSSPGSGMTLSCEIPARTDF